MVKIWISLMVLSGLMMIEHKKELDRWDESISVKEILDELIEARSPYAVQATPTQIKRKNISQNFASITCNQFSLKDLGLNASDLEKSNNHRVSEQERLEIHQWLKSLYNPISPAHFMICP